MDSTLPFRNWVLTFGAILAVVGVIALSSSSILGVENVLQSKDGIWLARFGGLSLLGTGLAVMGLSGNEPAAKILRGIGIIIASPGVVLFGYTILT